MSGIFARVELITLQIVYIFDSSRKWYPTNDELVHVRHIFAPRVTSSIATVVHFRFQSKMTHAIVVIKFVQRAVNSAGNECHVQL